NHESIVRLIPEAVHGRCVLYRRVSRRDRLVSCSLRPASRTGFPDLSCRHIGQRGIRKTMGHCPCKPPLCRRVLACLLSPWSPPEYDTELGHVWGAALVVEGRGAYHHLLWPVPCRVDPHRLVRAGA